MKSRLAVRVKARKGKGKGKEEKEEDDEARKQSEGDSRAPGDHLARPRGGRRARVCCARRRL